MQNLAMDSHLPEAFHKQFFLHRKNIELLLNTKIT